MHGPMFKMLLAILLSSIEVVNSTSKELEDSNRERPLVGREKKFNACNTIDWEEKKDKLKLKRNMMIYM